MNILALALIALLLSERVVEKLLFDSALLTVTAIQQLSLATMMLAAAEFMGFVSWWSTRSLSETRRRHRRHRIAATVVFVAFLASATRARVDGQFLEVSGGWDGVLACSLYAMMLVAPVAQLFYLSVKEIGRPDVKRRERLVATALIFFALIIGPLTLVQTAFLELFEQLGWIHSVNYRLSSYGFIFFGSTAATACFSAILLTLNFMGYCGLDRVSRDCRKLTMLCESMIAAVPEVYFELTHQNLGQNLGRRRTVLELHQATVQIRDAILQLRRYFCDTDPVELAEFFNRYAVSVDQHGEAALALQLAYAAQAKRAGALGTGTLDSSVIVNSRPRTLEEETAELLKLSRWWPYAQAATANRAAPASSGADTLGSS